MSQNCLTSCSIGCIFCIQGCNPEKLRNAFTFLPPQPSYAVAEDASGRLPARIQYLSEVVRNVGVYQQAADFAEVHYLKTERGERIPIVWMRHSKSGSIRGQPPPEQQPYVLLHCHGNATDIGMMMGPYFELSRQLACEVVGVEYSGYGVSTGSPCVSNTLADAEAAYDFLVSSGVPPERIIAYGQSVGSGPATSLAAQRRLGGLVLHSPMLSGIKVIDPQPDSVCKPSCVYCCLDFYPNDRHMRNVQCPVFVMHGKNDDIIPLYHGVRLAEAAPKQCRWPGYFPHAGHNDIVEANHADYFVEIRRFLQGVRERRGGGAPSPTPFGHPLQMEMEDFPQSEPTLPYAEPTVGPEDGRYENLRRPKGSPNGVKAPLAGAHRE